VAATRRRCVPWSMGTSAVDRVLELTRSFGRSCRRVGEEENWRDPSSPLPKRRTELSCCQKAFVGGCSSPSSHSLLASTTADRDGSRLRIDLVWYSFLCYHCWASRPQLLDPWSTLFLSSLWTHLECKLSPPPFSCSISLTLSFTFYR
jgi:hypothetical protein